MEERNYKELKQKAFSLGAKLFGVASITKLKKDFYLPPLLLKDIDLAVSLAVPLLDGVLEEIENHPTQLYFHLYRQVNFFLDRIAFSLSTFIQDKGYLAIPIPASQVINWEKQIGHLSHKKVALYAGLGWLGRNNLIVTPEYGARVRLVTILTNMPLAKDNPIERDCGDCKACVSICPAGAIRMNVKDFDHITCFEKLKEFKKFGFANQYICGVCVKACKGEKTLTSWTKY